MVGWARSKTLHAPALVALGALIVGLVDIVAAIWPGLTDRYDVFQAMLPPDAAAFTRSITFAAGVALLVLSAGLARRKHRAWLLATGLVVFAATAHMARGGFDVEQAVGSAALLTALVALRRRFDVAGDPTSLRPLAGGLAASAVAWAAVVALGGAHTFRIATDGFEMLLAGGAFWALHHWLRSHREPGHASEDDRARVRELVDRYGHDSLSFFSLRADRRYVFSRAGNAFLAYRVVAGCALVAGDPIGVADEIPGLIDDFGALCGERGWRMVALHSSEEWLDVYRRRGMRAVPIGDEAILRPATFSLEGRAVRKVRQSVTRLRKLGYTVSVVAPSAVTPRQRADIERVSREWRGRSAERGFSMAMDDLYAHDSARFALALGEDGTVGGFLHLVPSCSGYSLSAMRRGAGTPNGLMEFLICETTAWAGTAGADELSLNFAVFADVLRADDDSPAHLRAARQVVVGLDRAFQLDRLFSFNRKFQPEWRTRYICFERARDVPALSFATLHVERLIAPPPLPALRVGRSAG
jgi:lysyl-tRNA synthetase, class II